MYEDSKHNSLSDEEKVEVLQVRPTIYIKNENSKYSLINPKAINFSELVLDFDSLKTPNSIEDYLADIKQLTSFANETEKYNIKQRIYIDAVRELFRFDTNKLNYALNLGYNFLDDGDYKFLDKDSDEKLNNLYLQEIEGNATVHARRADFILATLMHALEYTKSTKDISSFNEVLSILRQDIDIAEKAGFKPLDVHEIYFKNLDGLKQALSSNNFDKLFEEEMKIYPHLILNELYQATLEDEKIANEVSKFNEELSDNVQLTETSLKELINAEQALELNEQHIKTLNVYTSSLSEIKETLNKDYTAFNDSTTDTTDESIKSFCDQNSWANASELLSREMKEKYGRKMNTLQSNITQLFSNSSDVDLKGLNSTLLNYSHRYLSDLNGNKTEEFDNIDIAELNTFDDLTSMTMPKLISDLAPKKFKLYGQNYEVLKTKIDDQPLIEESEKFDIVEKEVLKEQMLLSKNQQEILSSHLKRLVKEINRKKSSANIPGDLVYLLTDEISKNEGRINLDNISFDLLAKLKNDFIEHEEDKIYRKKDIEKFKAEEFVIKKSITCAPTIRKIFVNKNYNTLSDLIDSKAEEFTHILDFKQELLTKYKDIYDSEAKSLRDNRLEKLQQIIDKEGAFIPDGKLKTVKAKELKELASIMLKNIQEDDVAFLIPKLFPDSENNDTVARISVEELNKTKINKIDDEKINAFDNTIQNITSAPNILKTNIRNRYKLADPKTAGEQISEIYSIAKNYPELLKELIKQTAVVINDTVTVTDEFSTKKKASTKTNSKKTAEESNATKKSTRKSKSTEKPNTEKTNTTEKPNTEKTETTKKTETESSDNDEAKL